LLLGLGCAPLAAAAEALPEQQKADSAPQAVSAEAAEALPAQRKAGSAPQEAGAEAPGKAEPRMAGWVEAELDGQAEPRTQKVIVNEAATSITTGGDLFSGYTRTIPYERMIPPYGLQVTFGKTVHIIFPAPIRYVDLGDERLIAGKAGEAENVLRVKSSEEEWRGETNMSVITDNGSFYTFNVKYAAEPEKLNIEMQDFTHDGSVVNRPNNSLDIYLKELNGESPRLVRLIMQSIHRNNVRLVKHIGARGFGIQLLLKGIYSYNGMLYFHTEVKNSSPVDYNVDYLSFRIVDRQLVKRTTIQETELRPVRAYNHVVNVRAKKTECTVFAIPIFTVMPEKVLRVDLHEKEGGRNFTFDVETADLVRARDIKNFTIN
jgi:conjugative transposon TraN protein